MLKRAAGHIHFVLWSFAGLVLLGWLLGQVAWVLVIGMGAYIIWSLVQSLRLHRWLYDWHKDRDVPESYGMWGDLFDGLHQVEHENKRIQEILRSMIERIRSSTNALKDGVIMTDAAGHMDWWNESAGRLFGFQRDKDQGQLITNLIRAPSFSHYFEEKNYAEPMEISAPKNVAQRLRFEMTLFGEDERLILIQDVSRLHRLEQMRRDFVSNVSHEMRTPLTVIRGYLEALQDSEEIPPKWKRPMRTMMQQTQRLEALIKDLMLLEKYETEEVHRQEQLVDVSKLLHSICHDAQVLSAERAHQIRLDCQHKGHLRGLESQLRSAFSNLVFNAVKYTPAQGSIEVHWWVDEQGAHLSVRDNGCGFDPVHIPRLTERFYRVDPSRDNSTGGSGLGLAIVKHVLINHGATLEIHSEVNAGSEFICHFPASRFILAEEAVQAVS